jgi:hypothetical protein
MDMSYRLILSVLLSTALMLTGCTTSSPQSGWWNPTWHTPWHSKPHHPVPANAAPASYQNVQTPYVYSSHMPPYTRVGTPYTITSQPVYPLKKNNSALPYTYSYNMPYGTHVGTPYAAPPELNPNEVVSQYFNTSYYNSIKIDGTFHTVIKGNQSVPCVKITGPRYALRYVNISIMNNELIIRTTRNTFGLPQRLPVSVEIVTSDIQNLTINGNGTTVASNIGAQGLNVNVNGNGSLRMTGNVTLYQLNVGSNSNVNIYWVNSSNLLIRANDSAKITLAGVATNLEANLFGNAVVDAKYLRSQVAYLRTLNYSCAWVYVSQSLSAYARDYSDIYYYPDPLINGPFYVRDHGAIMRMAGLPY